VVILTFEASSYSRSILQPNTSSLSSMGYSSTRTASSGPGRSFWGLNLNQRENLDKKDREMESILTLAEPLIHQDDCKLKDDDDTTIQSFESMVSHLHDETTLEQQPTIQHQLPQEQMLVLETPSTVSTAETDDASIEHFPLHVQHRRVPSWEASPRSLSGPLECLIRSPFSVVSHVWGQQRIENVRDIKNDDWQYGFPPLPATSDNRWLQTQHHFAAPQIPCLSQVQRAPPSSIDARRPFTQPFLQRQLPVSPPRTIRASPATHRTTPGPAFAGSRSSSEVLKTLLRKKACLYEPDTSRAVALVTWLVGRELALEYGFFSRQQLQAGVHSCVTDKIESGAITRTKVNRCMQIILNSCFHYIIPRPDGTEENGDAFRYMFEKQVDDDSFLLEMLPDPWKGIRVDRDNVLCATADCDNEQPVTPQHSPRLSSTSPDKSPSGKESVGDESDQHKRAVLLCFNENVRKAEDVFRCHNEFIRDTAHASHLQLSSHEWRLFFGDRAAGTPYLWGNIGIPLPYAENYSASHVDALGMMSNDELGKFRTSWCTKRYDHDHELCGFAHVNVNGGWLRRNPLAYNYNDKMCPAITNVPDRRHERLLYVIHECPHGNNCQYAHSHEEIVYQPRHYKTRTCSSGGRPGGCHLGDVCSKFHPVDSYRFPKKSDARSTRHARHTQQQSSSGTKPVGYVPSPAPILYCSPAPLSDFEEHLVLPGLQSLYRRQCLVVRDHLRKNGSACCYSLFGDGGAEAVHTRTVRGLPTPEAAHRKE
jgi:hypothetical protein